jgi:hypothetical protein
MDEPQSAKTARSPAKPSNIGKIQMSGITEDHFSYVTVSGKQNAKLSPKLTGQRGEVFGQLYRDNLVWGYTTAEGPFQSFALGLLYSQNISIDLLDSLRSWNLHNRRPVRE